MSTASFSVFTAGKDKNIRSVTVTAYMSVEQSVPRGGGVKKKNHRCILFWITNLGAGSILLILEKCLG